MKKPVKIQVVDDGYFPSLHVSWWSGETNHAVEYPIDRTMDPRELPEFFKQVQEYLKVRMMDYKP